MQYLRVCLVACVLGFATGARAEETVTVRPADNGAALANPGMGWVFHYYDNVPAHYGSQLAPSDTLDDWPGLTVIYLRIPWSYIEPEEGKFRWSVLDTPAQRWIAKGKQVAFRITASESWTRWATPKWVADAGAKGYNFRPGQGVQPDGPFWEPEFDDPVFLDKLDHFLAAHWWPHEFLQENRELVRKINLRLGYRLQLVEASWPKTVLAGGSLKFAIQWRNAGVAPCLPGGHPIVTLKDAQGGIVAVLADEGFDVRSLPVKPPDEAESRTEEASFVLPFQLRPEQYELFISIGTRTGTPKIALPLAGDDGQRRYRIGTIQVVGQPPRGNGR